MKSNETSDQDKALGSVLKEWHSDVSLPPRFQEQVWRRIERAEASSAPSVWATLAHWVGTMLPRPALAASYLMLLLAVGVTLGWAQARQETSRVNEELGQRYVQVLDPYLTPRRW